MRRVLITGGTGQVGRSLIRSAPADVQIFHPTSIELDVTIAQSVDDCVRDTRPDLLINAAAYTAVDKAETEEDRAFAVNAVGCENLARVCRSHDVPLIHLSTDYVFDGSKQGWYVESDPAGPLNAYGRSKLEGERRIIAESPKYLILRVSWVYSRAGQNFVRTMLRLANQDSLRVVNDQLGTPCSADDVAEVVWLCAGRPELVNSRSVLHYSSAPETTWFEFARAIFDDARELGLIERAPRLHPVSTAEYASPTKRPANSRLDASRLHNALGIDAHDWRKSLRAVLVAIARGDS